MPGLGGGHVVERPGPLPGLDRLVAGVGLVEELDFHAGPRDVRGVVGGAEVDARVALGGHAEIEPEYEVGIGPHGREPAAPLAEAHDRAVGDLPGLGLAAHSLPAVEALAVEERDETRLIPLPDRP